MICIVGILQKTEVTFLHFFFHLLIPIFLNRYHDVSLGNPLDHCHRPLNNNIGPTHTFTQYEFYFNNYYCLGRTDFVQFVTCSMPTTQRSWRRWMAIAKFACQVPMSLRVSSEIDELEKALAQSLRGHLMSHVTS